MTQTEEEPAQCCVFEQAWIAAVISLKSTMFISKQSPNLQIRVFTMTWQFIAICSSLIAAKK